MGRKYQVAIILLLLCLAFWTASTSAVENTEERKQEQTVTGETELEQTITGEAEQGQTVTGEAEQEQTVTGETEQGQTVTGETDQQAASAQREEQKQALTNKLYARAAVLIDMDSGRVLYEKNGTDVLPMASTTKIMTCIMALELGDREETVTASAYAAGQPKVHLGMQKGMSYQMDDLLHSLMLESHNDSAVAIAEHLGAKELGLPEASERTKEESREAVKVFCDKMTEKAREIGCEHTCFLTPNGLDAEAEGTDGEMIVHSTTAEDLARIMRYCITQSECRDEFLEITQSASWAFTDTEGKRNYSCNNHNAFLTMMDGALSGKTGFTNQAGYCYVGALERDGKQFALALLACGWPNHKTWKWSDSRALFTYGLENYQYREFAPQTALAPIPVMDGAAEDGNPFHEVAVTVRKQEEVLPVRLLTAEGEEVVAQAEIRKVLQAPVKEGEEVGCITYYLVDGSGERQYLAEEAICAGASVEQKDFLFVVTYLWKQYLL